jgi:TRAP transporter TAXI family solute receptor
MERRAAGLGALGIAGIFMLAVLAATGFGTVNGWAQRISFAIATGPSSGTYFPVGETIAGLVSHPPGVDRCDRASVCGPEGLIATAQTSPGSYANILSVNAGRVDSALAQSDVIAQAVRGIGVFRGKQQSHIRVIAALFPEDIHLIARTKSRIASVGDLRGKRVSIGAVGSGTAVTARMVLDAYGPRRVHISTDSADTAAQKLEAGKIDAFFFVGGAPVPLVRALIASGSAMLVPIDGPVRDRLIAQGEGFSADEIPSSAYGNGGAVQTLAIQSLWIVNDAEPADIVYALTRALFNRANRSLLDQGPPSVHLISLKRATKDLPAPLHPGAERFYRESGEQANYTLLPR